MTCELRPAKSSWSMRLHIFTCFYSCLRVIVGKRTARQSFVDSCRSWLVHKRAIHAGTNPCLRWLPDFLASAEMLHVVFSVILVFAQAHQWYFAMLENLQAMKNWFSNFHDLTGEASWWFRLEGKHVCPAFDNCYYQLAAGIFRGWVVFSCSLFWNLSYIHVYNNFQVV